MLTLHVAKTKPPRRIRLGNLSPSIYICQHRHRSNTTAHAQGTITPQASDTPKEVKSPFFFETGYALYAKRPSRPFPPPFASTPSGSFSEPLTTHNRSRDRRPHVNGQMIRGLTNGDDAVLVEENFVGANDGVGAWASKPRGHAALWSRLVLHFWALEAENETRASKEPDPIAWLQRAYDQTVTAASKPNEWLGTTTACAALLHHKLNQEEAQPVLYATNLGDSQILVLRPKDQEIIYKTAEQWHWFDCPRQLGTNSPDTPTKNAVMDKVDLLENDVVLAVSDGVTDNLWEHEMLESVLKSIHKWEEGEGGESSGDRSGGAGGGMPFVAEELAKAARVIAQDPFAESPFMEKAVEEGLAMEGGEFYNPGHTKMQ